MNANLAKRHPAPWSARNCFVHDGRGRLVCSASDADTARDLAAVMAACIITPTDPPGLLLPSPVATDRDGECGNGSGRWPGWRAVAWAVVGGCVCFLAWWAVAG